VSNFWSTCHSPGAWKLEWGHYRVYEVVVLISWYLWRCRICYVEFGALHAVYGWENVALMWDILYFILFGKSLSPSNCISFVQSLSCPSDSRTRRIFLSREYSFHSLIFWRDYIIDSVSFSNGQSCIIVVIWLGTNTSPALFWPWFVSNRVHVMDVANHMVNAVAGTI